ncbi:MAG: biotin--[acetyl-CoA-carboxylase] ligase [Bacteroidetes bacterium]|nr:biotin--[acetyl-CoA-carboxylase] ligase [Bacteroidota bacterium]
MFKQIIGSHVIRLPETASTNLHALRELNSHRPAEGSVYITDNQTQGRGLETNSWESEPGKNLTFSFILYPSFLPVDKQFRLNQCIALGISDFVKQMITDRITVKWPNDIYYRDKKICGTLIQNSVIGSSFDYSVIGIGMNVNQAEFLSEAPNPVSMMNVLGIEQSLENLSLQLFQSLDRRYWQLMNGEFEKLSADYLNNLYRMGEIGKYMIHGIEEEARITGVSNYGHLLLKNVNGKSWSCDLKEVKYL